MAQSVLPHLWAVNPGVVFPGTGPAIWWGLFLWRFREKHEGCNGSSNRFEPEVTATCLFVRTIQPHEEAGCEGR